MPAGEPTGPGGNVPHIHRKQAAGEPSSRSAPCPPAYLHTDEISSQPGAPEDPCSPSGPVPEDGELTTPPGSHPAVQSPSKTVLSRGKGL